MAAGNVKWFNNAKGYGFILPEGGGEDLFAHYSSIQMDGYKTLKAGQAVEFDLLEGPKGSHAVNIRTPDTAGTDTDIADPQSDGQTPGPEVAEPEPAVSETSASEETTTPETTSESEASSNLESPSASESASVPSTEATS